MFAVGDYVIDTAYHTGCLGTVITINDDKVFGDGNIYPIGVRFPFFSLDAYYTKDGRFYMNRQPSLQKVVIYQAKVEV